MEKVRIFWDPKGIELNTLGDRSTVTNINPPADGDTPYIKSPVRMLGIDTPETNYPGVGSPANSDDELIKLGQLLRTGKYNVDTGLIRFLLPKLSPRGIGTGTLQKEQGDAAKVFFQEKLNTRLVKPNGRRRNLFLKTSKDAFDMYGRLLAYMAPKYTKSELQTISPRERATFNFNMLESGWAAPLIIYPNLPKNSDLNLTRLAVKNAVENKLGAWKNPKMLTGYEWRMCIKLYNAIKDLKAGEFYIPQYKWISRYCVDMTTLEIYYPQEYYKVAPYNRIFIFDDDIKQAVSELNLSAPK